MANAISNMISKVGDFGKNIFNFLTGQTQEDERTKAVNQANLQATQNTNATNFGIAQENLNFQRELQEYNKALQERMFEREDTAYQRTKQDMLAAGLNPLSMQGTNGAGEAIAQAPLNNQYQAQAPQFQKANTMASPFDILAGSVSASTNLVNTLDQLKTGKLQRDGLQLANERSAIENLIRAKTAGVGEEYFNTYIQHERDTHRYNSGKAYSDASLADTNAQRAKREYKHMQDYGLYDSDSSAIRMLTDAIGYITSDNPQKALEELVDKYPRQFAQNLKAQSLENKKKYLNKYPGLKPIYKMLFPDDYEEIFKQKVGTTTNNEDISHTSGKF